MKWFLVILVLFVGAVKVCTEAPSPDIADDSGSIAVPDRSNLPWPQSRADGSVPTLAQNLSAKNYYVVFDGSGSMSYSGCSGNESKMEVAKRAVADFAGDIPHDANLGLITFDTWGIREVVPLGLDNRPAFADGVGKSASGGATPLKDSIALALEKLEEQARAQLGYGEYHLVVVTDGEAYPEDQDPRSVVNRALAGSPVVVHTVGFCIGENHSLNQSGRTLYHSADDPEDLAKGLESVLAEAQDFNVDEFK